MTDPRQAEVWHKKAEVADRTLNERKYCKPCDYYYSEMFTCPICYGEQKATEHIIKLLEEPKWHFSVYATRLSTEEPRIECASECLCCHLIALIEGEQK